MTPIENSLRSTLSEHPEDWSIRFLLIEKALERDDRDEAIALVIGAPSPPQREDELHRVVELAGVDALPIVSQFVQIHPANGYGHQLLGSVLQWSGDEETAQQHFRVAVSLGITSDDDFTPETVEETSQVPENAPPVETSIPLPDAAREEAEDILVRNGPTLKAPKQRSAKATAIFVAVGVHLLIAVIATLVVILPERRDEPEIVAAMVAPPARKQEMQKKTVAKQTKKTTSASAAAAPLAQLMRSNAMARISLPNVTRTSTGPLGIGDADFGAGGFGSGTEGMGSGETMFGSQSGTGLIGSFYDLKQNRNGEPTSGDMTNPKKFNDVMQRAARSKFAASAFSGFFKAPIDLRFGILAIPTIPAEQGPAAFAVEKEVKPMAWLVHYTGRVTPPENGKWRFVGYFDDALIVFINDKVVLDASWMPCFRDDGVRQPFGGPAIANGKPAVFGNWVDFKGAVKIDILVGERPGGQMGGALMAQKEGVKYKKRKDGTPILPIFSTGKLEGSTLKRLTDYPYEFHDEEAIFRLSSGGF